MVSFLQKIREGQSCFTKIHQFSNVILEISHYFHVQNESIVFVSIRSFPTLPQQPSTQELAKLLDQFRQ